MKKEILTHFLFSISFGIFVSIFRGFIDLKYWTFWVGIVLGTILPNVDYLIYSFFLRPQEFMSQRTAYLAREKKFKKIAILWSETARAGATKLVFHTYYFQVIFLILTFWVVTSSGSPFGIGLTLAFCLHLLVDQLTDFFEKGTISDWFKESPVSLDVGREKIYFGVFASLLVLIGFFI